MGFPAGYSSSLRTQNPSIDSIVIMCVWRCLWAFACLLFYFSRPLLRLLAKWSNNKPNNTFELECERLLLVFESDWRYSGILRIRVTHAFDKWLNPISNEIAQCRDASISIIKTKFYRKYWFSCRKRRIPTSSWCVHSTADAFRICGLSGLAPNACLLH